MNFPSNELRCIDHTKPGLSYKEGTTLLVEDEQKYTEEWTQTVYEPLKVMAVVVSSPLIFSIIPLVEVISAISLLIFSVFLPVVNPLLIPGFGMATVVCAVVFVAGVRVGLVGLSIGSIICLAAECFKFIKKRQFDHTIEKINQQNQPPLITKDTFFREEELLIEENGIKQLMHLSNKNKCIDKMNFHQLYYVSKTLPETEFRELIKSIGHVQHRQWKSVLDLPKDIDSLKGELKLQQIKDISLEQPLFKGVIAERFKEFLIDTEIQELLKNEEDKKNEESVTFIINGKPCVVAREKFENRNECGVLAVMTEKDSNHDNIERDNDGNIVIDETDEGAALFIRMLEILNGRPTHCDLNEMIALLDIANKYGVVKLCDVIDIYLASEKESFSEEEIIQLCEEYPLKNLKQAIERRFIYSHPQLDLENETSLFMKRYESYKNFASDSFKSDVAGIVNQVIESRNINLLGIKQVFRAAIATDNKPMKEVCLSVLFNTNYKHLSLIYNLLDQFDDEDLKNTIFMLCDKYQNEILSYSVWPYSKIPEDVYERIIKSRVE